MTVHEASTLLSSLQIPSQQGVPEVFHLIGNLGCDLIVTAVQDMRLLQVK